MADTLFEVLENIAHELAQANRLKALELRSPDMLMKEIAAAVEEIMGDD